MVKSKPSQKVMPVVEEVDALTAEQRKIIKGGYKVFDLREAMAFSAEHRSRSQGAAGVVSLIFSARNGRRVELSRPVVEHLGNPEKIQVGFLGSRLLLAVEISEMEVNYPLKKQGLKCVIYSSGLLQLLVQAWDLDFSDCVCKTFSSAEYGIDENGDPIVLIDITEPAYADEAEDGNVAENNDSEELAESADEE